MADPIAGAKVGKLPRPSRAFAAGRTCSFEDCHTVLSRYNPTDRCWGHRQHKAPGLRGRR